MFCMDPNHICLKKKKKKNASLPFFLFGHLSSSFIQRKSIKGGKSSNLDFIFFFFHFFPYINGSNGANISRKYFASFSSSSLVCLHFFQSILSGRDNKLAIQALRRRKEEKGERKGKEEREVIG